MNYGVDLTTCHHNLLPYPIQYNHTSMPLSNNKFQLMNQIIPFGILFNNSNNMYNIIYSFSGKLLQLQLSNDMIYDFDHADSRQPNTIRYQK